MKQNIIFKGVRVDKHKIFISNKENIDMNIKLSIWHELSIVFIRYAMS